MSEATEKGKANSTLGPRNPRMQSPLHSDSNARVQPLHIAFVLKKHSYCAFPLLTGNQGIIWKWLTITVLIFMINCISCPSPVIPQTWWHTLGLAPSTWWCGWTPRASLVLLPHRTLHVPHPWASPGEGAQQSCCGRELHILRNIFTFALI